MPTFYNETSKSIYRKNEEKQVRKVLNDHSEIGESIRMLHASVINITLNLDRIDNCVACGDHFDMIEITHRVSLRGKTI